ncbi:hypothetical protein LTR81_016190 [Elasticomyces elasticus]
MTAPLPKRIIKETERLQNEPVPGISAQPHDDNARYFDVMVEGPGGSCYEGGVFNLELFLPDDYPMCPPRIRFLTRIYHPNIDRLGRICLDVLKNNWSPALQIRTILLSIQALLGAPNPEDPLNEAVAKQWKENQPEAIKTAREWTRQYAQKNALTFLSYFGFSDGGGAAFGSRDSTQSSQIPELPPAIPPKDKRRGVSKVAAHSLESSTAVPAFTGGDLTNMSSAVERRRRGSLPVTRVDSTAASRSTNKPTRTRIRDLKPVHTPVPALLPSHKLPNHSTPTEVTSSVDGDAVANMSKLQARDDIHFGTSNVGDLKQMIQSLDDEMDELEASNNMLKSTMEWDSDEDNDVVEKPALRRLFSTLKRKSAVSDRRYTMYSRSSQDTEDTASRRQSSFATYARAPSLSRLSQEEIDNNSEEFKSMFTKRMQAKAKLRVGPAIVQQPTSATPHTSTDLTQSLVTTPSIASRADSDPFVGALVPYKPLPALPVSSSAITLHVTSPSHNIEPSHDVAQSFMQKYPPPPDPATPTKSAGRSLRYAKSETSIRSSAIGPKLAPQIAPAKRTANVEITNPDDNPGVYIAKVAVSAGLPQSPLHPDWEAAIKAVKTSLVEDLKEADRRARDEVKLLKVSANEKKQAERLPWNEHGDRITSSAGRLERVPTVDYAAMTDHDLRMFRVALQRETKPGKPTGVVKRLLGQTNEQKTKEDVIRNAVLAKQKWLVDRELEARLEATAGSTPPTTHSREDRLDQQTPSSARGRAPWASAADSPEPESATGGRHDMPPHARHNELHCTDTGLESLSTPGISCTTPAIGLGIFGASEDNVSSTLKATPHLDVRSTPKHSPSVPPVQVHGSGSTTPATPSHPRSPFGEAPLKVTPRNHVGSPVFQPKRNNSFKRKIEAAADRARELKSIGSHPALRESPSKSSLPPVPNTAPLITLNDIWDFDRGEDGRYDSVVKEDEPDSDFGLGNAEVTMESPTFTVESDSEPRKSVFKWDDVDEGYAEQPRSAGGVHEAETDIIAVALHDELKHLSEFMSLKYPGRPESDSDDETEYVDNPDYNPAHDISGESTVLIDDVIAQWESPSTSSSHSPSTKICCTRAAGLLKASGGYDQLTAYATAKLDLRHFHPSATDSRDALLTCAVCSKVVCPKCAKLCIEALCRQVMCKECGRSAEGRCDIH